MSTDIERELAAEIDDSADEGGELAVPDEEQQNVIQMHEIAEMTVEPGLMQIPVVEVTTAKNSEQWAVTAEHPVEDELTFYFEKPRRGWTEDEELVQLLRWYDVHDRNPYELQTRYLYAEYDEARSEYAHGWVAVEPPDYSTPSTWERISSSVSRLMPSSEWVVVYPFLFVGAALAPFYHGALPIGGGVWIAVVESVVLFVMATVIALLVLEAGS